MATSPITTVSEEVAARTAADDALDARINNVLSNTDPTLVDSFTEVIAAYRAADAASATTLRSAITAAVSVEATNRDAAIAVATAAEIVARNDAIAVEVVNRADDVAR